MPSHGNVYQVSIEPLEKVGECKLAVDWKELESRADNPFFLSWLWISTWLKVYQPNVKLLRVVLHDQVVALGLFTLSIERRHGWLQSRVLRLHQTGNPEEDQIWIEYNDLLSDRNHTEQATIAAADYLTVALVEWDECIIGASSQLQLGCFQDSNFHQHLIWTAPCYGVDLKSLRDEKREYLTKLSRNTRYQIRRAYRQAEEKGAVKYSVARNRGEAIQWFSLISDLHKERWGKKSGFNNPAFVSFHRELVSRGFDSGSVEFFRVDVAGKLLGILYNFIHKGTVYFYLSGINYVETNDLKPGLICHAECIQQHTKNGRDYYDFMGGDSRYKRSLGDRGETLQVVSYQRPVMKLKLEQKLRQVKRALKHE